MEKAVVSIIISNELEVFTNIQEKVKQIFEEGTADNTIKAYTKDVSYFFAWATLVLGREVSEPPVSKELLVKFIIDHLTGLDPHVDESLVARKLKASLGTHSVTTVARRVTALSAMHRLKGTEPNPCTDKQVTALLSKARKRAVKKGNKPNKKKAATLDKLDVMLETCDDSLAGIRDRALLLFAFSSGGRRASEVSGAVVENLTQVGDNFVYLISKSKTDQEGKGHVVPIKGRAADALRKWLEAADINDGNIFRGITRHGYLTEGFKRVAISRMIKGRAEDAGLNPEDFASHSMRSGFVTEGGRQKKHLASVMALSGHKTVSVAMGYFQAGAVLENEAGNLAG